MMKPTTTFLALLIALCGCVAFEETGRDDLAIQVRPAPTEVAPSSANSRSNGLEISETTPEYMRGLNAEAARDWEAARTHFARAALNRVGDDEPLLAQARTLHAMGRPWEAASMLESFARSGVASPVLLKAAGDAIMAAGSPQQAVTYYRQAMAARPGDPLPRLDYACALFAAGSYRDAVALYSAVPIDQLSPMELLLLGRAALQMREGSAAADALKRYVAAVPSDADAWLDLARSELLAGRPAAALAALRPVVKANPHSREAAVLLGHIHVATGKPQLALDYYDVALQLGASSYELQPLVDRLRARDPGWVARP